MSKRLALFLLVAVGLLLAPGVSAGIHLPLLLRQQVASPAVTATSPPTATGTATSSPTGTWTATGTPTASATRTPTRTRTATATVTRTATRTATATATPEPPCPCYGDVRNCSDFATQAEAQACYDHCVAEVGYDVHHLDSDGDGEACESLP